MLKSFTTRFLQLALDREALRFGNFTLKSGRESPYFFNAGEFSTGAAIDTLSRCYAEAIVDAGVEFDMLFGPAYKGIPLATAVALSLSRDHGIDVPFAYNRKEAKRHGEGGVLVGAPLAGRVLIVDDVISAGTSIGEALDIIADAGATATGVAIALDRQERGTEDERSAVQVVESRGLQVVSIASLQDLIDWLASHDRPPASLDAVIGYQQRYGA
ncbi:orotate phosphoribosyltransferase [Wenzhouxiangella sediminis]|uniref:Orotate phosphoribosyltransferase n=1 Tax=Wenzhouxiangella sediminis TaxID=1792836 RepID=A0A3E1K781_9GAMM|nr:orotate phosphoribosyltransferase [Wenzhouxiangella sediminis]RFF29868.1 orotate phosphoribosyltransferase [Wenzhouxiangella sediminis]